MEKYVAYYAAADEHEFFNTTEEAQNWLEEYDSQDGISEETISGKNYIAEVKLFSSYRITDEKKNYKDGEWPYPDEYDNWGIVEYVPPKDARQDDIEEKPSSV